MSGPPPQPGTAPSLSPVETRQIIDYAADGIFVADAQGRYVDANAAGLAMLGYTLEELRTLTVADVAHPDSFRTSPPRYEQLAAGEAISVRRQLVRKDGTLITTEITGRSLPSGHIVGIVRDLSHSERVAETLHLHERLVASSPDLISVVDASFTYRLVNDAYVVAHATSSALIVGRTVAELLGREVFEQHVKPCLDRALCGELVTYESWFDFKGLGRRFCAVQYTPYRDGTGEILGVAVNVRDTTKLLQAHLERKKALEQHQALTRELEARVHERTEQLQLVNDELAVLARTLEGKVTERTAELLAAAEQRRDLEAQLLHAQKMEAVGRLVAGVAHDFNNLLTGILANACLLQTELNEQPTLRPLADEIVDVAERAAALTARLLAFGRREPAAPSRFDLVDLVHGFRSMVGRLIGEDIAFVTDLHGPLVIEADPRQIEQVILNLAVNARDAMPQGGELRLSARAIHAPADGASPSGRYVELVMADTGEGMSAEVVTQIFEPFFTTKPPGQGTGLGLSTVRNIVTDCRGVIGVETRPDHGTVFRILLPQVDGPIPEALATAAAREPVRRTRGSILVVDDDPTVRKVIERLLLSLGYNVVATGDPLDAIALVDAHQAHFDLLLTDIVLPNLSGQELIKRVRSVHPDVRVLVMTGYGGDAFSEQDFNGIQVLGKPFRLDTLANAVEAALH